MSRTVDPLIVVRNPEKPPERFANAGCAAVQSERLVPIAVSKETSILSTEIVAAVCRHLEDSRSSVCGVKCQRCVKRTSGAADRLGCGEVLLNPLESGLI